jgi:hypothetical protein
MLYNLAATFEESCLLSSNALCLKWCQSQSMVLLSRKKIIQETEFPTSHEKATKNVRAYDWHGVLCVQGYENAFKRNTIVSLFVAKHGEAGIDESTYPLHNHGIVVVS